MSARAPGDRRLILARHWPMTGKMPDYPSIVRAVRKRYRVRVRRWRPNMSGCAWQVYHADGRTTRWIEAPRPRTPISLALFLHEVGHHIIGFGRYRRRCEEEYAVWMWALAEMRRWGVDPDDRVERRVEMSMRYAVQKAMRRGIRDLPEELIRWAA